VLDLPRGGLLGNSYKILIVLLDSPAILRLSNDTRTSKKGAEEVNRKKRAIGAAAVAVLALGGGGAAIATQQEQDPTNGGDSSEQQATGANIEKAKSAALEHTNGGRVTGTEVGDEEGYYEIEVTRDDGSQVDVHLDRDLNVLGTLDDHENPDDKDGPNDD
jgi:uncharacterized membrane protein YkoI